MANPEDAIAALQQQYDALYGAVDDVVSGNSDLDADGKTTFYRVVAASHDNLLTASVNKLTGDDPTWQHIGAAVATAQTTVNKAVANISSISTTLNTLTTVVGDVTKAVKVLA